MAIRLWLGDREWARHLGSHRAEAARDPSIVIGSAYGRALSGLIGGALDTINTAESHFGLRTIGTIQKHIPFCIAYFHLVRSLESNQ
jgi:hypothetical protein